MGAIEPVLQFCLLFGAGVVLVYFLAEFGLFMSEIFKLYVRKPDPIEPIIGRQEKPDCSLIGERGEVLSTLRPAGIASLRGDRVQVVARYGFIDEGETVRVTRVEGNQVYVEADTDDLPN